jgi:cytosine permease
LYLDSSRTILPSMNFSIPDDFSSEPIPQNGRQSSFSILLVWLGFVLVVGIMAIGGGLAGQMNRSDLITSILVGNLALGIIAAFTGYIGARSGLSFNMLMSRAFPGFSWRIVSLYVPIVLVGWYAIEASLFANYVTEVLGWGIIVF